MSLSLGCRRTLQLEEIRRKAPSIAVIAYYALKTMGPEQLSAKQSAKAHNLVNSALWQSELCGEPDSFKGRYHTQSSA